jgi:4-amino-4-deoxy-L-arabinose transferase-like glycosyltransferase
MDPRVVLLVAWVVVPLLLFSLSRSKRPQYVLPLVPAIALLCAMWWDRHGDHLPGARLGGSLLAALGAALVALATRIPAWVDASPAVAAAIPGTARWLGAAALAGGAGAIALARRRDWGLLALVLPVAVIPVVAMPLMDAIGADRSSRAVAEAIGPVLSAETEVVAVGTYPLSLPFYLDRTLTLVTADARELTSNYLARSHERLREAPRSTLRPPDWWEEALALCERPRVFVVPLGSDDVRRRLEAALPLRALSRKIAVYGPCGPGTLARRS